MLICNIIVLKSILCVMIATITDVRQAFRHRVEHNSAGVQLPDLMAAVSIMRLNRDEKLFVSGETKDCIYRLEGGIVRVTLNVRGAAAERIEDLHPGMVIGSGYLDHHIYEATALVDSYVSCWSRSAFDFLAEHSPSAAQRQADENEREFAHRRNSLAGSMSGNALHRVAAFLIAISQFNQTEGRDPKTIGDSLRCGVVADYLNLDVDVLGETLAELQRSGLIALHPPRGLRLLDVRRLDLLALGA